MQKMKFLLVLSLFLAELFVVAQVAPDKYFVEFKDKNGTPYSISQPEQFLSQRAIDRRNTQFISFTDEDLPVNPAYVQAVSATGVTVLNRTKWLNGVSIYTTDPAALAAVQALPFVKNVLKKSSSSARNEIPDKFLLENFPGLPVNVSSLMTKNTLLGFNYGPSYNQIHMLNGDLLHTSGYRGQGKVIAILDGGFLNADQIQVFDSLRNEGRLLGTKDFVEPGGNVFTANSAHGTMVLSTMAGNIPGQIIGTAPKASYWLLRTEDVITEFFLEEYNWVSGAEFADSVGADVINSSLGYTEFNEPTFNHTCADMNGNTTVVTRGANIAASKGIAVVNSAGNSGGSGWTCVGAPADGNEVLAVGAVDSLGNYAFFSSVGVDTAGRVKPNVASQGESALVCGANGFITRSNGTSFSSPIMAGMVACLWQAQPTRNRQDLLLSIEKSASHYLNPDSLTGYGIPNFQQALLILSVSEKQILNSVVYPNPFRDQLSVQFNGQKGEKTTLALYDVMGRMVGKWITSATEGENRLTLESLSGLIPGVYLLTIGTQTASTSLRVVKL